jgi:hypothetical protein
MPFRRSQEKEPMVWGSQSWRRFRRRRRVLHTFPIFFFGFEREGKYP